MSETLYNNCDFQVSLLNQQLKALQLKCRRKHQVGILLLTISYSVDKIAY